jgi:hypothetical protein
MLSNTSSHYFSAVTSVFEDSASTASYTVYEIKRDGHVLNSQFTSKTKAFDFARNYTSQSSQVYVYKTKCIKIFDAEQQSTTSSGVRTRSQRASDTANDTIFAHNVDMLIQAAEQVDYDSEDDGDYVPSGTDDEDEYADMPHLEHNLTGLQFSDYGKGYLLMPNTDTTFTGTKYLNDGWWNQSQGGWFFRSQYYDDLIATGAVYTGAGASSTTSTRASTRSSSKSSTGASSAKGHARVGPSPFSETRDLTGFSIEPYGKGFIVRCAKSNPLFRSREPYLLGNLGWWNANGQGWFFQSQYQTEVVRLGATVIKQESETSSSGSGSGSARSTGKARSSSTGKARSSSTGKARTRTHFVTSDTQFMETTPEFQQYGKGWLLPASEHHTFDEHGKYFQGGFWMPKNNGWFFRTADRDAFVV